MNIAFDGIGELCATFLVEEEVAKGTPVKMVDNGMVTPCTADNAFIGIAMESRDGAAAVQLGGFVTVNCPDGTPRLGKVTLAADGSGGVKAAADGTTVLVVATDEEAMTAVIYLS